MNSALVAAPAMIYMPFLMGSPYFVANRVAAERLFHGLFMMSFEDPAATVFPSITSVIARLLRLSCTGIQSPTAKPIEEQLSATTSSKENLKFWYLESMISMAAARASTYSITSVSLSSPLMSFEILKQISGSTRGWINWLLAVVFWFGISIAEVSRPQMRSCTPICCILASEVNPIFSPMRVSPSLIRRLMSSFCTS